jgi:hypothetical protein
MIEAQWLDLEPDTTRLSAASRGPSGCATTTLPHWVTATSLILSNGMSATVVHLHCPGTTHGCITDMQLQGEGGSDDTSTFFFVFYTCFSVVSQPLSRGSFRGYCSPEMADAPTLLAYRLLSLVAPYPRWPWSQGHSNPIAWLRVSSSILSPAMRRVPYPINKCTSCFPPDEVLG